MSDASEQGVAERTGDLSSTYVVTATPGSDALIFTSASRSAPGAVETANAAVEQYVYSRRADAVAQLSLEVAAAQAVVETTAAQLGSLPQDGPTASQRTAYAQQLSSALADRQQIQQQLDSLPDAATILNVAAGASRAGASSLAFGALGALLGAIVMVLAIALRDRLVPRFAGTAAAMSGADVFSVTVPRKAPGDAILGAVAVSVPSVPPGSFLAVVGPSRAETLRSIGGGFSRRLGTDADSAVRVVDLSDTALSLSELETMTVETRSDVLSVVILGGDARAEEMLAELATASDTILYVVEPDVSRLDDVDSRFEPMRRTEARVVWIIATDK